MKSELATPAQIRAQAERWYLRQLDTLWRCHGDKWPEHREWVETYLKEELWGRLLALGWRPKG